MLQGIAVFVVVGVYGVEGPVPLLIVIIL